MSESGLASEVAKRAGIAERDAEAALDALIQIADEKARAGRPLTMADLASWHATGPVVPGVAEAARELQPATAEAVPAGQFVPGSRDIRELIATASRHPLGLEFLLEGQLGAVAVTFRTHAFTVEAARREIASRGMPV